MGLRFQNFAKRFEKHFWRWTRSRLAQARQYLQGLMQARRKNMERMEEVVPDCDYQSLQHFLSNSEWDARAVLDQVAVEADRHLGGSADSCLLIDESSFQKKGEKSVGVARQWSGRLGKVDNCQVAVFAALAQGSSSTLIDTRLYLPKEWTDDPKRCRAAGVPSAERVFKSKADLAFEMVVHARQNGVRFGWVGADGGYGKDPGLLRRLADHGETFVTKCTKINRSTRKTRRPACRRRKRLAVGSRLCLKPSVPVSEWTPGCNLSRRRFGRKSRFVLAPEESCAWKRCLVVFGYGMAPN